MARTLLDLRVRAVALAVAVAVVHVWGTAALSARAREATAGTPAGPGGSGDGTGHGAWGTGWEGSGWGRGSWVQWQAGRESLDVLAVLLLLAGPAALLLRGRPLARAGIAVGAAAVSVALGYVVGPVFLGAAVTLIGAVREGGRVPAWVVAAAGWPVAVLGSQPGPHPLPPTAGLGAVVWVVALLAVADVVRGRRQRRAAEARAREEQRLRRVSDERLHIARDLHDGVAHQISLIRVRAGVALHLLDQHDPAAPDEAREALRTISQASSEALGELRAALDALRASGEPAPRAPVPGLVAGAGELVRRWHEAGLAVAVDGLPDGLPPAVDQAAYRVVQEALTNVSRHSVATAVAVRLEDGGGELVVTVTDPGPARPDVPRAGEDRAGGTGLIGMHERIALLGGTLSAGPSAAGWRVRAVLPLRTAGGAA